ncbi:hypothetical protein HPP92_012848 [Vanilla planifolia]|uniref:RING-type E3 ubiquitin transferase n=1 Tax=Vanilla planifolia TaxID=51239 RepID=A0A835QSY0_VANPL|nr:hypothetical protein HPP92_012848 [Vanilla planifolia]
MSIPSFFTVIPVQLTVFFLIVFVVFFFFFLRLKRQMGPSSHIATSPSSSSAAVPLDLDVLKSLPSAVFRSATDGKAGNALECAVCLSELTDGEVARLLPRCHHTFHLACIDTWFLFNSTCPICRSAVELPPASEP